LILIVFLSLFGGVEGWNHDIGDDDKEEVGLEVRDMSPLSSSSSPFIFAASRFGVPIGGDIGRGVGEDSREFARGFSMSLWNASLGISGDREVIGGDGSGNRQDGMLGAGT
jgi:hypothetical protein